MPAKRRRSGGRSRAPKGKSNTRPSSPSSSNVKNEDEVNPMEEFSSGYELQNDFQDEEIDEEEAFTTEDYQMYGDVGRSYGKKAKKGNDLGEDDEFDNEEAGAIDASDESDVPVDLSEMISINLKRQRKEEKAQSRNKEKLDKKLAALADSDFDEDEDEDAESDDDKAHGNLLSSVAKLNRDRDAAENSTMLARAFERSQYAPENEHGAGTLGLGNASSQLNMDDLLKSMNSGDPSTREARVQVERLRKDKAASTLAAPLKDVAQEQVEREVAFDDMSRHVSRWTGVVKSMREASSISFPLVKDQRLKPTTSALTSTFVPSDNLEKDFSSLLERYGVSEKEIESKENAELLETDSNDAASREAKLNEMKKTRSLMFHHEIKLKRIKKIKSRTYRKLAKKRKEKQKLSLQELEQLNPDLAETEKRKIEANRVRERMSLRHKNTSKWVKRQLRLAKANPAMRGMQKVIGQQLNINNELTAKMKKMGDAVNEDGEDWLVDQGEDELAALMDDEGENTEEDSGTKSKAQKQLEKIEELKSALEYGIAGESKPRKGLLSMKFMQRAMEKRATQAQKLLDEFKAEVEVQQDADRLEGGDDEGVDFSKGSINFEQIGMLSDGKGLELNRSNGRGQEIEMQGNMKIDIVGEKRAQMNSETETPNVGVKEIPFNLSDSHKEKPGKDKRKLESKSQLSKVDYGGEKHKDDSSEHEDDHVEDDDEFAAFDTESKFDEVQPRLKRNTKIKRVPNNNVRNNPWLSSSNRKRTAEYEDDDEDVDIDTSKTLSLHSDVDNKFKLDKTEIMHQAFALGGNTEKDFQAEKNAEIQKEIDVVEEGANTTMPGWGTWGGEGVKKPKRSKRKQVEVDAKIKEIKSRRTKGPQHVIINLKRNKKAKKYTVSQLPFPFTSKAQYEKSLRQPLGRDWNTLKSFQEMTKPEVITKTGTIIEPMSVKALKRHKNKSEQGNKEQKKKRRKNKQ